MSQFWSVRVYNRGMRRGLLTAILCVSLAAVSAAEGPDAKQQSNVQPGILLAPCAPGSIETGCNPSKSDLKKAKTAFQKALRLEKEKHPEQALDEFETAVRLDPRDIEYATSLALVRQELVFQHVQRGNAALLKGDQITAQAEFGNALKLDPQNDFAQQRLKESLNEWPTTQDSALSIVPEYASEVAVKPSPAPHDFQFRGDGRELLTQVAKAYGIIVSFDDKLVTRHVRFDLQNVDFYAAMRAACDVTRTFWAPMSENQIIVAGESPDNHRQYDRMSMRTFHIEGANTPQELTEVTNLLRTVFEIRFLNQNTQAYTITVRAPQGVLDAATTLLEHLPKTRPQVMLDMELYQVSNTMTRALGIHIPNNFTLFNIPAAALLALGGQNISGLINQLISSGGINQAGSSSLSALLSQLTGQQNSLFSQPVATFGGGLTMMGLTLDQVMAQLSLNQSQVKTLDHASFRVGQGNSATFKVGARYPIINASFAPIFNTSAISQVLQNGSFQAPIPSVSYEDVGLDVKAKPVVDSDSNVTLELEMQLRAIESESLNGVPVIGNREYKGSIILKDGEPAVVASEVDATEIRTMTGIPGLGLIPILNKALTTNSFENDYDEMLLVITPHILSAPNRERDSVVWLPQQ